MFPLVKKIIDGVPLVRFMIECTGDRTSISNIESAKLSTMSSYGAEIKGEHMYTACSDSLRNNTKSANLDYHLDNEHNVEFTRDRGWF